ncbi:MAG: protease pro-enzyme activation domain-containing protein [Bryobacteraceae bacterium]
MIKLQHCLAFWAILGAASPALFAQPDRIAARIDNSQSVVLTGRVHRLANAKNDAGPVEGSFGISGMTLELKPSATQQADLNQLLLAQQDPQSPSFRQWLTPEQYADRFGTSAGDLAKITAWLESQGFSVSYVARSRNFVLFGGTAQQVAGAFRTQIHRYNVDGATHYANATDPSIPAALAGLVSGIRGLHNFRLKPGLKRAKPQATVDGMTVIGPADFAAIYDVAPLYTESVNGKPINGAGQSIVIVGQSEILKSDISSFRTHFGLGALNLTLKVVPFSSEYPNGGSPGFSPGDELESDLDIEWSGAVAPDANIIFVYSGDVFTSSQYAIAENLAPVLSMSYGGCEQADFADLDTMRGNVQQAVAEGVTMLAAAGDTAAADCDSGDTVAQAGLAVDAPGSIPEVVSMGGTEFTGDEGPGIYWRNGVAIGYIPEAVWNETAVSVAAGGGLLGGGGGASIYFTQPPWQNGIAPNDGMRHVPDLSSAAAVYHDPFYVYSSDSTYGPAGVQPLGGTSCAAPSMAGIVALLNQYLVSSGAIKQPGLGNINPTLYKLAQTHSSAFHDIVKGNNIVPCVSGTPSCVNGSFGWSAGPAYDSASGLGSVDAYSLVHAWNTALASQAVVVPSLDQNPVYETSDNLWTFNLTLTEEAGIGATLTGLTINGIVFTPSQIQSLFGAAAIPASGSISASYSLRGLDVSSGQASVVFAFSGVDANGNSWSNTMTVPFAGPQPSTLLAIGGISNAANGQVAFAPGMIASVYGTGLGSSVQVAAAATISSLPDYLAGFEALVYNTFGQQAYPLPLFYVSPNQVNLQLPYELDPGPAEMVVYTSWNASGMTYDFTVAAAAPGIFSYADSGANSSPIGSGSARAGDEIAIYVTGMGQVNPLPGNSYSPDGVAPSLDTVPVPTQPVAITVGGVEAVKPFAYIGIPSWSVGVTQINFNIPSGVATGPQPVVVFVGGVPSLPANITISQ